MSGSFFFVTSRKRAFHKETNSIRSKYLKISSETNTMSGNTVFAIISVSTLIAMGLTSAIIQAGIMIFFFGKWGPAWLNEDTGQHVVYFLSDMFVLSPGLAYGWTIAIIPSVTIASIVIHTSICRDRICRNETNETPRGVLRSAWNLFKNPSVLVNLLVFLAYLGLLMICIFDLHHPSKNHYVGVGLFALSGVFLNFWVIYLDYNVERTTWHPVYVFDCLLILLSVVALFLFSFGGHMISACSEWIVLVLMLVLHTLLPIRGARVVLSKPQGWYHAFHRKHGRGQIVLTDPRPPNKIDM
jgi:hypothetical protein